MDTVPKANQERNVPESENWIYNEMLLAPKQNQTERKSKRVAFRTESGNYIRVDPEGHLTCSSIILDDNSIFDLIRPIETGVVNIFLWNIDHFCPFRLFSAPPRSYVYGEQ